MSGYNTHGYNLLSAISGYAVTDNYFAFMGHIIGEGVADETLSVGKHIGSYLVTEYLALVDSL